MPPAVLRWLVWCVLIVLLAGWEPGSEQIRFALTAASLVIIGFLLIDVAITAVVFAGSRARRKLAARASSTPRRTPRTAMRRASSAPRATHVRSPRPAVRQGRASR